jgi:hypothetical protein
MGRALAPVPFSSTVYLAAEALMLAGSDAQKQKWLPKIASGEAIGSCGIDALLLSENITSCIRSLGVISSSPPTGIPL